MAAPEPEQAMELVVAGAQEKLVDLQVVLLEVLEEMDQRLRLVEYLFFMQAVVAAVELLVLQAAVLAAVAQEVVVVLEQMDLQILEEVKAGLEMLQAAQAAAA